MRDRLMVGRRTLDPLILVRFQVPQPFDFAQGYSHEEGEGLERAQRVERREVFVSNNMFFVFTTLSTTLHVI